ncbi:MAG: hypothetical protein HYY17_10265 [Planctomycetes bacterium]|nr:hypothetical protein [Planctomycetota bacterium]
MALSVGLWVWAGAAQEAGDPRYEIPYDKLSEKHRKKVRRVMEDVTVAVPLDSPSVASRREFYDFLLEELPFTAEVCREMGRSKYEVYRDPRVPLGEKERAAWRHTCYMEDKDGLSIKVELVLAEPNRRIFYTWGSYDLSPLPAVWGRSVIVTAWEEKDGKLLTGAKVFAQVDSAVYRALSDVFQGWVRDAVKEKSALFVRAARWVAEAAAEDPKRLYEQVKGAKGVDEEALEEFRRRFVGK